VVRAKLPRLVIAGMAGDSGKSLVSLGLIGALRRRGLQVAPFKKGPDYIDAAWLGAAADSSCRNLDSYLMTPATIRASVAEGGYGADLAVVEGNRGLFDGMDALGSHSTARLARLIGAPIVLVVDVRKSSRTVAAQVLGCCVMEPGITIAGVILNRVGTLRQEKVIRDALANTTDVPVLGAIPHLAAQFLPSRHLGLVTAMEHPDVERSLAKVAKIATAHLDLTALVELARTAAEFTASEVRQPFVRVVTDKPKVRIGVLRDRAFSFYYPENLAALEAAGAELCPISPLADPELPAIDGLYAGGGFPEEYATELAANQSLRRDLARQIAEGLPVWAECGGLMYLSQGLVRNGSCHEMVGALPTMVEQMPRPQGHGYVQAVTELSNPFLASGTCVYGHEFHYSRLVLDHAVPPSVFSLSRGVGIGDGRDGIQVGNAVASYTHLHALATPEWADGLVAAAVGARL